MRSSRLVARIITSVALGLGGVLVADLPPNPQAQNSSQFLTKAEFDAANRSANQRA